MKKLKLKSIFVFLAVFSGVLFFAGASLAANHYVTSTGAGSKNGSDWANAYQGFPASLTRGDNYYIAAGTYGGYTFNTPNSDSSVITIKKATASDHG